MEFLSDAWNGQSQRILAGIGTKQEKLKIWIMEEKEEEEEYEL